MRAFPSNRESRFVALLRGIASVVGVMVVSQLLEGVHAFIIGRREVERTLMQLQRFAHGQTPTSGGPASRSAATARGRTLSTLSASVPTNSSVAAATLSSVRVAGKDGDVTLACAGVFSFIGAEPASEWLSGCAALDERGFVLTDRSLSEEHLDGRWETLGRQPLPYETNHPGLFAVGDVRAGSTKRVAASVGEGSAAVRSVHDYLAFAH